MEYNYPDNTNDCSVTYMRTKTGPNHFRVYYNHGACIRFTPVEVGRVFGIAKFTPLLIRLEIGVKKWWKSMMEKPIDEVTTLPCEVCGEPKTVNVVYLPYLDGVLPCNDPQCTMKTKKKS